MFDVVETFFIQLVDILKVFIPCAILFGFCGDLLFKDR